MGVLAGPQRAVPSLGIDTGLPGAAISAFGFDLFGAVRRVSGSAGRNVIVSPVSVAIALAMLEPGTVGPGASALTSLLRIADTTSFHASMNALEQELEARAPQPGAGRDAWGDVIVNIANAAFLQSGYPFAQAYVDAVRTSYGAALHTVDFMADPVGTAEEINAFVAQETSDRISRIVPEHGLHIATKLALVNALFLKATWVDPFDAALTEDRAFTLLDGETVPAPLMSGSSATSARGDGWVGATKPYRGGFRAEFVLPDQGRFEDVAVRARDVFAELTSPGTSGGALRVPRFGSRVWIALSAVPRELGLGPLFLPGHLRGIADDDELVLGEAFHATYLAMDEEGTEAAAATAVMARTRANRGGDPVAIVLDRPFLFRILDRTTGTTLMLGQVLDPSR